MSQGSPPAPQPYPIADEFRVLAEWVKTVERDEIERVRARLLDLMANPDRFRPVPVPVQSMGLPALTVELPGTRTMVTFYIVKSPPYEEALRGIYLQRIETEEPS